MLEKGSISPNHSRRSRNRTKISRPLSYVEQNFSKSHWNNVLLQPKKHNVLFMVSSLRPLYGTKLHVCDSVISPMNIDLIGKSSKLDVRCISSEPGKLHVSRWGAHTSDRGTRRSTWGGCHGQQASTTPPNFYI